MPRFWAKLKKWHQVCAAILATVGVVAVFYELVSAPILYFERTQASIAGLSNRIDEISYKVDLLLGGRPFAWKQDGSVEDRP